MDKMVSFDAILFPADERAPHLVPLMMSNAPSFPPFGQSGSQQPPSVMAKVPHPEMYMDFIAEGVGARAWKHHVSYPKFFFFACFYPPSAFHFFFSPCITFFISLVTRVVRSRNEVGDDHPIPYFCVSFPIRLMLIRRI